MKSFKKFFEYKPLLNKNHKKFVVSFKCQYVKLFLSEDCEIPNSCLLNNNHCKKFERHLLEVHGKFFEPNALNNNRKKLVRRFFNATSLNDDHKMFEYHPINNEALSPTK